MNAKELQVLCSKAIKKNLTTIEIAKIDLLFQGV